MSTREHVILNVNLQGFGQRPAAWQVQDVGAHDLLSETFWHEVAQIAERGLLDAVFFADHPAASNPNPRPLGLVDPFVLAASLSAATERLGIIVSGSTSYNDPVEFAARTLGLDLVTGGRLGWNIVTTYSPNVAGNFGLPGNPDRTSRYRRATEFVDLVTRLWRSAADGAEVDHRGEFFAARTGLAVPPSPQGHPILFQAGGSPSGRELAARYADGVFAVELTLDGAIRHRREVKRRAEELGRDPRGVHIVPGLSLVIGSTEQEAWALYDDQEARVSDGYMLSSLSAIIGVDASLLDPDAPIPAELIDAPLQAETHVASVGYRETFLAWIADRRDAPLREVLRHFGGYGARILIGTPEQIADTIEHWFRAGAADGFNLMLDRYPAGLADFVDQVVPLLQQRGIHRREYEAATLRARLAP